MKPCILLSYAYFRTAAGVAAVKALAARCDVLLDSGAFTAHRLNRTVDIERYSEVCRDVAPLVAGSVQLDVPGSAERTSANLARQLELGAPVLPVMTVDMDPSLAPELAEKSGFDRYICVAGGLSLSERDMIARYQAIHDACGGNVKIHGLAFVRYPGIFQAPILSVDSSSHNAGLRFGLICYFSPRSGIRSIGYTKAVGLASADLPPELRELLMRCGITAPMWRDRELNRGLYSLIGFLTMYASIMMQRDAMRAGRKVYLAVASVNTHLVPIMTLYRHARWDGSGFDYELCRREAKEMIRLWTADRGAFWDRVAEACGEKGYGRRSLLHTKA